MLTDIFKKKNEEVAESQAKETARDDSDRLKLRASRRSLFKTSLIP